MSQECLTEVDSSIANCSVALQKLRQFVRQRTRWGDNLSPGLSWQALRHNASITNEAQRPW